MEVVHEFKRVAELENKVLALQKSLKDTLEAIKILATQTQIKGLTLELTKIRTKLESLEPTMAKLLRDYSKRFPSIETVNCNQCGARLAEGQYNCPMCGTAQR